MLTNPKAAVQYSVIFGAFMPERPSLDVALLLTLFVFLLEAGWYVIVAVTLSASRPRSAYLGAKRAIDRVAGTVMAGLGIKLLASR